MCNMWSKVPNPKNMLEQAFTYSEKTQEINKQENRREHKKPDILYDCLFLPLIFNQQIKDRKIKTKVISAEVYTVDYN